jgi:phenylalanine-4-hydroxylase
MSEIKSTGDIQAEVMNAASEYTEETQEIAFSEGEHAIWSDLNSGIRQPHLMEHISREYHRGWEKLQLDPQRIPGVADLNTQIHARTGWRVERTAIRYTQANAWYNKFAQRIFLITDYLRTREQMIFTPEPDMFHDIVGHLPYLTLDFYAALENKFAPAYLKATPAEQEVIKRLAWYSTEFGLVIEDNRLKIFGAGIISERSELANTIMEFFRLDREGVLDYRSGLYPQLEDHFNQHQKTINRISDAVNRLHEQGQMSSQAHGWNVMRSLYDEMGIEKRGYLGGDVIIAPFEIETISRIPKTVYAFNPLVFVFESFEALDTMLDGYLSPIASRA